MQKIEVPITGAVLTWAIAESGMTRQELAARVHVSEETLRNWEHERERPGKTEFGRLSEALRRPTATFFLPEPPSHTPVNTNFRASPGKAPRGLKREEARWLRRTDNLRELAAWLRGQVDAPNPTLPFATLEDPAALVAVAIRSAWGVTVPMQTSWRTRTDALTAWRRLVQDQGVLVFEVELGERSCRGFSLPDDVAPTITLNRQGHNPASRAYTLLHEYGHLLLRTTSVCIGYFDVRRGPTGPRQRTERWCDRFAAAVLLPEAPVREAAAQLLANRDGRWVHEVSEASTIADRFGVSLQATAVRLIDLDLAPKALYPRVMTVIRASQKRKRKKARGKPKPPRPQLRMEEYGEAMVSTVSAAVDRNVLTLSDALDTFDVSIDEFEQMNRLLRSKR